MGNFRRIQKKYPNENIIWNHSNISLNQLINDFYFNSDCLVIPTRGDAFCMPVLEGMATGLPVIVNSWGGVLDYCNSNNSYLIENIGTETLEINKAIINKLYPQPPMIGKPNIEHLQYLMRYVF